MNRPAHEPNPSIGRILHYRLTERDVNGGSTRKSSRHEVGQVVPLLVVRVWPNEYPDAEEPLSKTGVNGHAFLDAPVTLWITSAREGDEPGCWSWPPRI